MSTSLFALLALFSLLSGTEPQRPHLGNREWTDCDSAASQPENKPKGESRGDAGGRSFPAAARGSDGAQPPWISQGAQYGALCKNLCTKYGADTLGSITVEQDGECRTSKIVPLKFLTAADVLRLVDTKSNCSSVFSVSTYEVKLRLLNDELQTMMLPENS